MSDFGADPASAYVKWGLTKAGDNPNDYEVFKAGWDALFTLLTEPEVSGSYELTLTSVNGTRGRQLVNAHELAKSLVDLAGGLHAVEPGDRYVIERLPDKVTVPKSGSTTAAAVAYLRGTPMLVLDQDWCCDDGGISVIAQEGDYLVAVYVKLAAGDGKFYGGPVERVSAPLVMETRRLMGLWILQRGGNPLGLKFRLDVIGLTCQPAGYVIEHVRGAGR